MRQLLTKRLLLPLLLILTLPWGIVSCGYHLPGWADVAKVEPRPVHIAIFVNKTYRAHLEGKITNQVIQEFSRGKAFPVAHSEDAQLELSGSITSYSAGTVAYSATDTAVIYRATMTIEATLREKATNRVVWKGSLSASEEYPAQADLALQQNSENAAIDSISRKLSQRLYLDIVEDF
jgi:hypothetical protein